MGASEFDGLGLRYGTTLPGRRGGKGVGTSINDLLGQLCGSMTSGALMAGNLMRWSEYRVGQLGGTKARGSGDSESVW